MRIGYFPMHTFFHISGRYLFYDDFTGDMFTVRTHGNLITAEDEVSVILAKIHRPLWVIDGGTPAPLNDRLYMPIGNVVPQEMHTIEVKHGLYYRIDFQTTGAGSTGQFWFTFWYQDANHYTRINWDVLAGDLIFGYVDGAGWNNITAPFPFPPDVDPHYIEIVYDGVGTWYLYLDGAAIDHGDWANTHEINEIQLSNTIDDLIYIDQVLIQNYSPI